MSRLLLFSIIFFGAPALCQIIDDGRYVSAYGGYGILSSELSGSGFNTELPSRGGLSYGADISYQRPDSDAWFDLSYAKTSVDQSAPNGVTPQQISTYLEDWRFIFSFAIPNSDKFRIGLGYGFLKSGGTSTSPNNVLTTQTSQGLIVNASYIWQLKTNLELRSGLLIYLPHQVSESDQVTGHNPRYLGAEAKVSMEYVLSGPFVAFTGVSYRRDQVSFSGTGSRGVSGGKDVRTIWTIPLGIKIGY